MRTKEDAPAKAISAAGPTAADGGGAVQRGAPARSRASSGVGTSGSPPPPPHSTSLEKNVSEPVNILLAILQGLFHQSYFFFPFCW